MRKKKSMTPIGRDEGFIILFFFGYWKPEAGDGLV